MNWRAPTNRPTVGQPLAAGHSQSARLSVWADILNDFSALPYYAGFGLRLGKQSLIFGNLLARLFHVVAINLADDLRGAVNGCLADHSLDGVFDFRRCLGFTVSVDDLLPLFPLNLPPLRVVLGFGFKRGDALLAVRVKIKQPFPEVRHSDYRKRQDIAHIEEQRRGKFR